MELTHYLNDILIDEPIGFDKFKTKMKRGKYHGMSVEISTGELEFYGVAYNIISSAYASSVDEEVVYKVLLNGEEIYRSMCDLSTIKFHSGDYCYVACSMGDIGVKTNFNNNSDVDINLNSLTDIDGKSLKSTYPTKSFVLPKKTITFTNRMQQNATETIKGDEDNGIYYKDDVPACFLNIRFNGTNINEFGTFEPNLYVAGRNIYGKEFKETNFDLAGYVEPLFSKPTDFESKFGKGLSINVRIKATVQIKLTGKFFTNGASNVEITPRLVKNDGVFEENLLGNVETQTLVFTENNKTNTTQLTFTIDKSVTVENCQTLYFGFIITHNNYNSTGAKYYNNETPLEVTLVKDSFVELKIDSKIEDNVTAKSYFFGDALQKCVDIISSGGLRVVSEYYGSTRAINNYQPSMGGGWSKIITNGYFIRGLEGREFITSFKDLIETLSMQDCVGWGFEGDDKVRIEPFVYFYQNEIILSIDNPKEKTISVDTDNVCSVLNIGYKKYENSEDIKAIDSIHGERIYTSNVKAISKEVKSLSPIIADNYAIELTRRAKFTKDKEDEYKYDENVFVFSVTDDNGTPKAAVDFNTSTNVSIADDTYNVKLSPAQCALRWLSFIFTLNGQNRFRYTSAKLNANAKAIPIAGGLSTKNPNNDFRENSDLIREWADPILKAESLKITYPMTFEEYRKVVENPYGLVVVDGEEFWIKEFEYSLLDGECDLTLIKKQ